MARAELEGEGEGEASPLVAASGRGDGPAPAQEVASRRYAAVVALRWAAVGMATFAGLALLASALVLRRGAVGAEAVASARALQDQEACGDSLAASNCSNRQAGCAGSDTAQCNRCVYKIYCEGHQRYSGTCYGPGVLCTYFLGKQLGTFCFPSDAAVKVLEGEGPGVVANRSMEDLKVGDRVLTAGGFSEVYAFMDHAGNKEAEYLRLRTEAGATLRLTKEHIVFAYADRQPVLAEEVQHGDLLWVADGDVAPGAEEAPFKPSRVVDVSIARARGAHAPLTAEGSIVVDGVLSSSSAGVKTLHWDGEPLLTGHRAVMLAHAPLRFVCRLLPDACGPAWHSAELGRHLWTQWVLDYFGWLRLVNLEHHDLRTALLGGSAASRAAAVIQVLPMAALAVLDFFLFALPSWQIWQIVILGLLYMEMCLMCRFRL